MKKYIVWCLFLMSQITFAAGRDLGVGVTLFDPSGLTFKKWLDKERAFDGAIGWGSESIYIHANYLIHKLNVVKENGIGLDLYYGIGGRFLNTDNNSKKESETKLGIRIPGGAEVFFRSTQLGVFAEIGLILDIVEETSTAVGVSLGIRYYLPN